MLFKYATIFVFAYLVSVFLKTNPLVLGILITLFILMIDMLFFNKDK